LQDWDDPEPDDPGSRIVPETFFFDAGREVVNGDVLDFPRRRLVFRLQNDDGRYSPLNTGNPLNQNPNDLGSCRPVLVESGIPGAETTAMPERLEVPSLPDMPSMPSVWPDAGRPLVDWDESALLGHLPTEYELRHRTGPHPVMVWIKAMGRMVTEPPKHLWDCDTAEYTVMSCRGDQSNGQLGDIDRLAIQLLYRGN
jgi:hypothetical protein